jgi:hypothetical protein
LPVSAGGYEAVPAQQCQMLGHRGVAETYELGNLSDGALALDELAKNQQPVSVGERLQEVASFVGSRLQLSNF